MWGASLNQGLKSRVWPLIECVVVEFYKPVTLLACIRSLLHQMGIPRSVMINVSIVRYEAQHHAYDRNASLCSYIKQRTAFIYRRMCKMKYC